MMVLSWIMELLESRIPQRYWGLSLGDLHIPDKVRDDTTRYIARMSVAFKKAVGIIYGGPNGVGKTSLMCEIGKEAMILHKRVLYLTAYQYLRSSVKDPIDLSGYDMVLLDEIEKVYVKTGSDYSQITIENLLRDHVPSKPVICCTNMDEGELLDRFGKSTVSLMKRGMLFEWIDGVDYGDTLRGQMDDMLNDDFDYLSGGMVEKARRWHENMMLPQRRAWGTDEEKAAMKAKARVNYVR